VAIAGLYNIVKRTTVLFHTKGEFEMRKQFLRRTLFLSIGLLLVLLFPNSSLANSPHAPNSLVNLVLLPATQKVALNTAFDVTIQVQAGTQDVNSVGVHLDFNPTYLQVQSITTGATLPFVPTNTFDNLYGTLEYEAGLLGGSTTGTFTLATVSFKLVAATSGTNITFGSLNDFTEVYYTGQRYLGTATGASITAPTALTLVSFSAAPRLNHTVRVAWTTAMETNTIGFNLWRKTGKGIWQKLNPELIAPKNFGGIVTTNYLYRDRTVHTSTTYKYKLELVGTNGVSEWSKQVQVTAK
jgi:hypothetical protein